MFLTYSVSIILYNIGMKKSFSGNYHDCITDVKAATALRPSYLKAIIRGKKKLNKFGNLWSF